MSPEIKHKKALRARLLDTLNVQHHSLKAAIDAAREARSDETKSSAGDKYETGRSMIDLELEKWQQQLNQILTSIRIVHQINPEQVHRQIEFGSLVVTNHGNFFISIAQGKFDIEGQSFFCISLASPIGQQLQGGKVGDQFDFQGRNYRIDGMT